MIKRHKTRVVRIGSLVLGNSHPIAVESMTNANVHEPDAIIRQIRELERAGCRLVRIALPDLASTEHIPFIRSRTRVPLMGDIHFDHRIALAAMDKGIDSLRLNPGNIRQKEKIAEVVRKVKEKKITVRIGANSGSVDRSRYRKNDSDALVKSALEHIRIFEQFQYRNLIVSLKSTDILTTIRAYKKFSRLRNYPLHIGITEAGTRFSGSIKSAAGLAILLYEGLGDTLRISLAGDPVHEVIAGYRLLKDMGLYKKSVEVIACPTCGRTGFDVERTADEIEQRTSPIRKDVTVAVMGCIVNGPGEAGEADIGVAGSGGRIILFKKGRVIRNIKRKEILAEILDFIEKQK
ncbi:MAG: flavodoxin-dependent (E)-4-hydroxy-3-methylbut-2-enyl-diphosphate synthase [bacterium]|nr:flavodoxin-dependent (E)-4-hydroxy-3-methylbut-2-enyl-diphosphate synthase [bacterium]